MYEYGNARVAARRSALLDAATIDALGGATSAAEVVGRLERQPGWSGLLRPVRQAAADPAVALGLAVERFRASELASLPTWYEGGARSLVEALVMDLDRERVIDLLRRRLAGETAEAIGPTLVRGALLDAAALAELSRRASVADLIRGLAAHALLEPADAKALTDAAAREAPAALEGDLVDGWARARRRRARARGRNAALVRRLLAEEEGERREVREELRSGDAGGAALVERALRLGRLRRLARAGRRDELGIGAVAGYVAAVELQVLALRTVLARVAGGWPSSTARRFLAAGEA
jgi:vacuolar-type H+-ATPase subunit C/Vma6